MVSFLFCLFGVFAWFVVVVFCGVPFFGRGGVGGGGVDLFVFDHPGKRHDEQHLLIINQSNKRI